MANAPHLNLSGDGDLAETLTSDINLLNQLVFAIAPLDNLDEEQNNISKVQGANARQLYVKKVITNSVKLPEKVCGEPSSCLSKIAPKRSAQPCSSSDEENSHSEKLTVPISELDVGQNILLCTSVDSDNELNDTLGSLNDWYQYREPASVSDIYSDTESVRSSSGIGSSTDYSHCSDSVSESLSSPLSPFDDALAVVSPTELFDPPAGDAAPSRADRLLPAPLGAVPSLDSKLAKVPMPPSSPRKSCGRGRPKKKRFYIEKVATVTLKQIHEVPRETLPTTPMLSKCRGTSVPMRQRRLPSSFFTQPNKAPSYSTASECLPLPPLEISPRLGLADDNTTVINDDKAQKKRLKNTDSSRVIVRNGELLSKLFEQVETSRSDTLTGNTSGQFVGLQRSRLKMQTAVSKEASGLAKTALTGHNDPFLMENLVSKKLPNLSLDSTAPRRPVADPAGWQLYLPVLSAAPDPPTAAQLLSDYVMRL